MTCQCRESVPAIGNLVFLDDKIDKDLFSCFPFLGVRRWRGIQSDIICADNLLDDNLCLRNSTFFVFLAFATLPNLSHKSSPFNTAKLKIKLRQMINYCLRRA